MYPIDGPGATIDNEFTEGDPVAAIPATVVTAKFLNDVQAELLNILAATTPPTVPSASLQDQVVTAIISLITAAIPSAPADASETIKGVVELATTAEVLAGTDTTRAVTSAGLLAGLLGAGGTSSSDYATIPYRDKTTGVRRQLIVQWGQVASGGLSGTITFPLAFPNAVFSVVGTVYAAGSGGYNLNYGVSPSLSSIVWGLSIATAHRWIAVGY